MQGNLGGVDLGILILYGCVLIWMGVYYRREHCRYQLGLFYAGLFPEQIQFANKGFVELGRVPPRRRHHRRSRNSRPDGRRPYLRLNQRSRNLPA